MKRRLVLAAGVAGLLFGFLCLNYTKAFGVDNHYTWAAQTGMPAPSGKIYFLGVGLTALSAGAIGFVLGRRKAG